MKNIIKLEEFAVLLSSAFFLYKLNIDISWWVYILVFFSPDIGMIGYLFSTKIGAYTYNAFHHKAVASILIVLGVVITNNYLIFVGLIFLAHSSFDRILGFGLKYQDDFKHTNVGFL